VAQIFTALFGLNDDDLARVHVIVPKMLAPQGRLADLGGSVIPDQLKGQ